MKKFLQFLKSNKHKLIAALVIFALAPLIAYAQQEVLMTGQDSTGNTRAVQVDSSGRIVTASTGSSTSTSSGAPTYTPTSTTTTLVADTDACTSATDTDCTNVLAATELLSWRRIALYVSNTGANTLTDCVVSVSPDGSTWITWDPTTFDGLAAGSSLALSIDGNSYRYFRIDANSASGTTVKTWVTAAGN